MLGPSSGLSVFGMVGVVNGLVPSPKSNRPSPKMMGEPVLVYTVMVIRNVRLVQLSLRMVISPALKWVPKASKHAKKLSTKIGITCLKRIRTLVNWPCGSKETKITTFYPVTT